MRRADVEHGGVAGIVDIYDLGVAVCSEEVAGFGVGASHDFV